MLPKLSLSNGNSDKYAANSSSASAHQGITAPVSLRSIYRGGTSVSVLQIEMKVDNIYWSLFQKPVAQQKTYPSEKAYTIVKV